MMWVMPCGRDDRMADPRILAVFTLCVILAAFVNDVSAVHTLDLGGAGWQMYNPPKNISLVVSTPVYALEALYAAGVVKEDPLYRYDTCIIYANNNLQVRSQGARV